MKIWVHLVFASHTFSLLHLIMFGQWNFLVVLYASSTNLNWTWTKSRTKINYSIIFPQVEILHPVSLLNKKKNYYLLRIDRLHTVCTSAFVGRGSPKKNRLLLLLQFAQYSLSEQKQSTLLLGDKTKRSSSLNNYKTASPLCRDN